MTDELLDTIHDLTYEGGALRKVEYVFHEDFIISIIFSLDHRLLVVNAVADDDTVKLATQLPKFGDIYNIVDVSHLKPWNKFIQCYLQWIWCLTNQQGYFDGFQLCFRTEDHKPIDPSTIQLLVIASSFYIYILHEIGITGTSNLEINNG